MSKRIALIDADGIAYRVAATNEDNDSYDSILQVLKENINFIVNTTRATHAILFIKGDGNFRKAIGTIKPYKGNRVPKRMKWLDTVYYMLETTYNAVKSNGAEADDYIASAANHFLRLGIPHIVCSHDKDLYQIPGEHFDLGSLDLINISNQDAEYRLYYQILTGDTSDNIPGLPGIGEKKAEKILAESNGMYLQATITAYQNIYGNNWPQMFAENFQLVYLKNDLDLDGIENEKILSFVDEV